jgi:hypothetical protein
MNKVSQLQDFLTKEHPTFHWRCWSDKDECEGGFLSVEATINGRPIPHSPMHLRRGVLDNMGIESTAFLITLELSPNRADLDWDKLAEL